MIDRDRAGLTGIVRIDRDEAVALTGADDWPAVVAVVAALDYDGVLALLDWTWPDDDNGELAEALTRLVVDDDD